MRNLRYLDLSGYAFTGKHAVIDLIREFRGYSVPHFQFEFNLLRIQGGIRDLETALLEDWSPIRSDAAIRRFRRLTGRMAAKNAWTRPSTWFRAIGWNYDDLFRGQFSLATDSYVQSLLEAQWRTEWPYAAAEIGTLELIGRKVLQQLGIPAAFDFEYTLAAPETFLASTRTYLATLLDAFADADANTVVMHNSFEPFNPSRALRYFSDARSIIVDRDARDVYVAQNSYVAPGSRAKPAPYRAVAVSAEIFCRRFRLMRRIAAAAKDDPARILRIRFEDLVLRYEESLARIMKFLGETPDAHVRARQYFKPEISAKNIGIWRSFPDQAAIRYIAETVPQFCEASDFPR